MTIPSLETVVKLWIVTALSSDGAIWWLVFRSAGGFGFFITAVFHFAAAYIMVRSAFIDFGWWKKEDKSNDRQS